MAFFYREVILIYTSFQPPSECFSCPTALPVFGWKLGNRTPMLSLAVKEVTLIYRTVQF